MTLLQAFLLGVDCGLFVAIFVLIATMKIKLKEIK